MTHRARVLFRNTQTSRTQTPWGWDGWGPQTHLLQRMNHQRLGGMSRSGLDKQWGELSFSLEVFLVSWLQRNNAAWLWANLLYYINQAKMYLYSKGFLKEPLGVLTTATAPLRASVCISVRTKTLTVSSFYSILPVLTRKAKLKSPPTHLLLWVVCVIATKLYSSKCRASVEDSECNQNQTQLMQTSQCGNNKKFGYRHMRLPR